MVPRVLAAAALALCPTHLSCTNTADTASPPPITLRMSATTARDLQGALSKLGDVSPKVVTEGGSSVTGLQNLQRGAIDVAMTMADVAYLAYAGELEPSSPPFDQIRGMAVVNLNTLHLIASARVAADSVTDLKGLRVALGPAGSATALIAEFVLEAHGIKLKDVHSSRLSYVDTAEKLTRGTMDAAFMTQIPPSAAVMTAMSAGARLIQIDGPVIENLRKQYPYLKRTLIPRTTYPNQHEPVRTIGVDLLLVCRADVQDEIVYRLLDAYFATRPATLPAIDFERAPATPVPLHPGAARYYRQRELSR
jgi:TRAP transporter TAXI family solute receptor